MSVEKESKSEGDEYVPVMNLEKPLKPTDWKYKNEGGENIVLSYCGNGDHDVLVGKVLRVKKKTKKAQSTEFASYIFKKTVMRTLIGDKYIELGVPVRVVPEFLRKLNEFITPMRPKHRLKHEIDITESYALLMNDLTMFPQDIKDKIQVDFPLNARTFTVEIKPKSGVLPTSKFIKEGNACKYTTCRYCMHQYLKFKEKIISNISNYCPLDFFSRDSKRTLCAICNLLHSPQNNLKVYNEGTLTFTGMLGGKSDSIDVSKIFVGYLASGERDPVDTLVKVLVTIFLKEPLLTSLQNAQMMDTLDIEGIYYLQKKLREVNGHSKSAELENIEALDKMTKEQITNAINQFLIAATAKDCSIMVTLYPLNAKPIRTEFGGFPVVQVEGSPYQYLYRLSVVDLDPKSVENIESYYHLDQAITATYANQGSSKICKL